MFLLVTGILLWSVVHLFKAIAPGARQSLITRLGEGVYKGVFALLILASLALIVLGWRSSTPELVYLAPAALRHVTMLLMLIAIILFVASAIPSDIKRWLRHPQMLAVIVWSIAHLLSNGEDRSLLLFGGLGVWAVLEILFINRRDGDWLRPAPTGWMRVLIPLIVGVVVYAVVVYFHAYLAGVALITA